MPSATLLSATPLLPAAPGIADDLRFYTEQLGFTVVWQHGTGAGVRRGDVAFTLVESTNRNWAENASVSIATDDLDALYEEYRTINAPGARVGPLEMKSWGRREFHMILPSGVCFQFYQRAEPSP